MAEGDRTVPEMELKQIVDFCIKCEVLLAAKAEFQERDGCGQIL